MMAEYPHSPGFKENTTSREAAEALEKSGRAVTLRDQVKAYFILGNDATADEVAEVLNLSPFSVRPRFSELFRMGLIERTGERRLSSEGRPSHVYRRKVAA